MEEDEDIKKSKYSSGINILKRIDDLWRDTHKHSRAGQFSYWNADLDRIWLELARDLNDKKKEEELKFKKNKEKYDLFEDELAKLGDFNDEGSHSFTPLTKEQITKRNNQYKKLMEKQLWLAQLENVVGKGTTLEDDDDDDY